MIANLPVYFQQLSIENLKCFQELYEFNLANEKGEPHLCTVILGDNGMGKTTILKALANMETELRENKSYLPNAYFLESEEVRGEIKASILIGKEIIKLLSTSIIPNHDFLRQVFSPNLPYSSLNLHEFQIYAYGIHRKTSSVALSETAEVGNFENLFSSEGKLLNIEEWLLQLDYRASKNLNGAKEKLLKIKEIIISELLPDVKDFRFSDNGRSIFVEFETSFGWVKLKDLGYGYQACLAWMLDFAKRMIERYLDSPNPLREAAIVLVDEIDLHLHPKWQRKILETLRNIFPKTQFILTAHSPLIVQSAENINLILLQKKQEKIEVIQPNIPTFQGWTVEEILSELMGLEDKTYSEKYLALIKQFDNGLEHENYAEAFAAYNTLLQILHPDSPQRKLLRMQMASLVP